MIQANELRIGNVISRDFVVVELLRECARIELIDKSVSDKTFLVKYSGLEPTPITEEILLKCGFKIRKDGKLYHETLSLYEADFIFNSKSGIIKNLHQLQNLYFALTGQELEVNLC